MHSSAGSRAGEAAAVWTCALMPGVAELYLNGSAESAVLFTSGPPVTPI